MAISDYDLRSTLRNLRKDHHSDTLGGTIFSEKQEAFYYAADQALKSLETTAKQERLQTKAIATSVISSGSYDIVVREARPFK